MARGGAGRRARGREEVVALGVGVGGVGADAGEEGEELGVAVGGDGGVEEELVVHGECVLSAGG